MIALLLSIMALIFGAGQTHIDRHPAHAHSGPSDARLRQVFAV